jgi:hypothetical protein
LLGERIRRRRAIPDWRGCFARLRCGGAVALVRPLEAQSWQHHKGEDRLRVHRRRQRASRTPEPFYCLLLLPDNLVMRHQPSRFCQSRISHINPTYPTVARRPSPNRALTAARRAKRRSPAALPFSLDRHSSVRWSATRSIFYRGGKGSPSQDQYEDPTPVQTPSRQDRPACPLPASRSHLIER